MVVGRLPGIERLLTHLLRDFQFGQRTLGQLFFLAALRHTYPVSHVATGQVGAVFGIGHHADTLAGEAYLADISAPSHRVAFVYRVIDYAHHVLQGHVVHLVHAPVVGHFQCEGLPERVMRVGGDAHVVVRIQFQGFDPFLWCVLFAFVGELRGAGAQVGVIDGLQTLFPYGRQFLHALQGFQVSAGNGIQLGMNGQGVSGPCAVTDSGHCFLGNQAVVFHAVQHVVCRATRGKSHVAVHTEAVFGAIHHGLVDHVHLGEIHYLTFVHAHDLALKKTEG